MKFHIKLNNLRRNLYKDEIYAEFKKSYCTRILIFHCFYFKLRRLIKERNT